MTEKRDRELGYERIDMAQKRTTLMPLEKFRHKLQFFQTPDSHESVEWSLGKTYILHIILLLARTQQYVYAYVDYAVRIRSLSHLEYHHLPCWCPKKKSISVTTTADLFAVEFFHAIKEINIIKKMKKQIKNTRS